MPTIEALGLALVAYLWGSLSPTYLAARWRLGVDLRRYGSGNLGASNVGEQLGLGWKIASGLADVVKGVLPAGLARWAGLDLTTVVSVGLATIAGHNWSVYFAFTGGRGIAATLGVLLIWDPRLLAVFVATSALGMATHLGAPLSLLAVVLLAPTAWLLRDPGPIIVGGVIIALLVGLKRLDANRLPLPADRRARRIVLWRRLWLDRDVSPDQPWERRGRFDPAVKPGASPRSKS